jgi:hypothetical protein
MRLKTILMFLTVFTLTAAASAQTKISGTVQCGKADQEHSIQIGDRPNHSVTISQGKCTSTTPVEIAGILSKEGVYTLLTETSGNTLRYHFYYVDTMANGDKAYYRGEGTMTVKDAVPQSGDEKWILVRGEGKLKGIKGKGTNTLKAAVADGSSTWDLEGEYELPK